MLMFKEEEYENTNPEKPPVRPPDDSDDDGEQLVCIYYF